MLEQVAKWSMVGLMAFSALLTIISVGRPRKPVTGGQAATVVAVQAVWIMTILTWWH